jgi:hypothetical protein
VRGASQDDTIHAIDPRRTWPITHALSAIATEDRAAARMTFKGIQRARFFEVTDRP